MHLRVLPTTALLLVFAAPLAAAQDVASLGSVKITADEARQIAALQPRAAGQAALGEGTLEALLRQELVRRALAAEAAAQGWDKRPDIAERAQLAREQVIVSTWLANVAALPDGYPAESDVKTLYDKNREYLRIPRRYHLSQIFVRRPEKSDDVAAAEKRAADLAARAASSADFAALARAESDDSSSRDKGGDLGWFTEAALLPELRAAVEALKPEKTAGPIPAGGGWHIVRLNEVKEPQAATYEEARASLVQALRQNKLAQLRQAHIDALLAKTPPVIDRARLSALTKPAGSK